MGFILNRFKEASTWRGLFMLLTSAGISLNPEETNAIMTAGMAFVGLVGVFFPDKVRE